MYLKYNHISVKQKSGTAIVNTHQWSKQEACFTCANRMWLAFNHNTSDTYLANEFYVQSKLHGQVSLAAVNQI